MPGPGSELPSSMGQNVWGCRLIPRLARWIKNAHTRLRVREVASLPTAILGTEIGGSVKGY